MNPPSRGKKAAVLGGSWLVGRAVVESLLSRGHRVVTVNRCLSPATYSGPVERLRADRLKPGPYLEVLKGIDADWLVDATAYQAAHTRAVLQAFRGRVERVVHISSLSACRGPFAGPIPEDWPLEENPANGYGFGKASCDRLLLEEPPDRFPWSILRLPAVYGQGDPVSRENFYYRRVISGKPVFLPEGGRYLCQNVFSTDVGEACCRLLESPRSAGRVYNLGAPPFTLREYTETLSRLAGRRARMVEVKRAFLVRFPSLFERVPYFFPGDLVLDTERMEREMGFRPAAALEDGLKKTLAWLAARPPADPEFWNVPPEVEKALGSGLHS